MLKVYVRKNNGLIESFPVTHFNEEMLGDAKDKFEHYKKSGRIASEFSDDKWIVNNQKERYTIDFAWKEREIKQACQDHGADYEQLSINLKVFTIGLYGTCNLDLIRNIVDYCLTEVARSHVFTENVEPSITGAAESLRYYVEFIQALENVPQEYIETCIKKLNLVNAAIKERDRKRNEGGSRPCALNEFRSYFEFDGIIRPFWNTDMLAEERNFYYPLYLFWVVTTILPERVTEFCVIPQDCVREEDGHYFLTIRRSILKGSSSEMPKIHGYEIDKDYRKAEYEIPGWLYKEFLSYKKVTKCYKHPYGLLFSMDFMLQNYPDRFRTKNTDAVFLAKNLGEILSAFYKDIIVSRFGYQVVTEKNLMKRYVTEDGSYEMKDHEIMRLLPKHTRHLAMINLIYRGANPMTIKEFAGHVDAATSANYYGNICKSVRCATKYYWEKARAERSHAVSSGNYIGTELTGNALSMMINPDSPRIEVDNGVCHSENMRNGNVSDCTKCDGICENCRFFTNGAEEKTEALEKKIDDEVAFFIETLKSENITAAIDAYQQQVQQLEADINNLAVRYWRMEMEKEKAQWDAQGHTPQNS